MVLFEIHILRRRLPSILLLLLSAILFSWSFWSFSVGLMALSIFSCYVGLCFFIKDPSSPVVIVGIFWVLYVLTYPLWVYFYSAFSVDDYLLRSLFYGGISFYGFMLGGLLFERFGICRNRYESLACMPGGMWFQNLTIYVSAIVFFVFLPFYFYELLVAFGSNAEHKYELESSGFGSLIYVFIFSAFLFFGGIYERGRSRRGFLFLVCFVFIFVVYYLFAGERDLFVRAVMLVVFLLYLRGDVTGRFVWLIIVAGVLSQPLLQAGKGLLSFGGREFEFTAESFFSGEFGSQGRNFYYILQGNALAEHVYEGSVLRDVRRFFNFGDVSSTNLFGSEFMGRKGGAGMGFSLLAQMYLLGGGLALFLFGFLSALIMQLSRKALSFSLFGIYFYITSVFAFGYSLRADVANLLSQFLKFGLVPVLIFFVFIVFLSPLASRYRKV